MPEKVFLRLAQDELRVRIGWELRQMPFITWRAKFFRLHEICKEKTTGPRAPHHMKRKQPCVSYTDTYCATLKKVSDGIPLRLHLVMLFRLSSIFGSIGSAGVSTESRIEG